MTEQAPKRGRKKGKGRVVVTNVRMTKETHERLKALARFLNVETMSDAIDFVIFQHYPQVEQVVKAGEENQKLVQERRNKSDN